MLEILARAQPRVGAELARLVSSIALTTLVFFSYELDGEHSAWLQRCRGRQRAVSVICGPDQQLNAAGVPARAIVTKLQALSVEGVASCS